MHLTSAVVLLLLASPSLSENQKRALQKSHEKPQLEKWSEKFLTSTENPKENLVRLITDISNRYLSNCVPIMLYDRNAGNNNFLMNNLLKESQLAVLHGQIDRRYRIQEKRLLNTQENSCISYILFIKDVMKARDILDIQTYNRIVIVTESTQWRVNEFLYSDKSRKFINLLIVSPSSEHHQHEETYILYTHKLYMDGLGSSGPLVLTAWKNKALTRPWVDLFPQKIRDGFSGHRFITALAQQAPFVIRRGLDDNDEVIWDGIEIRLLKLLSELYNFTTDFKVAKGESYMSSAQSVIEHVESGKANVGIAGVYVTNERIESLDLTYPHSQDCASFVSLTSTALPRYRAIMGPFHWSVWLALTATYLLAVFPLAFADKHTLIHLIKKPEEIENMFWYVFGTFTNCFTFGKESWTNSDKLTPRLFMGFYWIFTTIITACYTGSIIAFITLPVYPVTVDTVRQLLSGRFQIGTLNKGGWETWFQNSSDPYTAKLLKNVELISDIESGLRNTTRAFFWPYAFLGSTAELNYVVRTNFSTGNKRSLLHISSECFVPFGVSIVFSKHSEYREIINTGISKIVQSGFLIKFKNDIEWDMIRSSSGKLLQTNQVGGLKTITIEDRSLTLDDTQGMFLLLSAGFLMGACALISEILGGCFNCCKRRRLSIISLRNKFRLSEEFTYSHENILGKDSIGNMLNHALDEDMNNSENNRNLMSNGGSLQSDSTDFERELNELFNFDELFGEESYEDALDEELRSK